MTRSAIEHAGLAHALLGYVSMRSWMVLIVTSGCSFSVTSQGAPEPVALDAITADSSAAVSPPDARVDARVDAPRDAVITPQHCLAQINQSSISCDHNACTCWHAGNLVKTCTPTTSTHQCASPGNCCGF